MDFVGTIVVVTGPACSGKSTFAKHLAKKFKRGLIIHDEVLSELKPDSDRNPEDRLLALYEMHKRAWDLSSEGKGLILEGTYSRADYRDDLGKTFSDTPILIVQMRVPVTVALDRFEKRKDHPGIDLNAERVQDLNLAYPYSDSVVTIDGMAPFGDQLLTLETANIQTASDLFEWKQMEASRSA